MLSVGRSFFGNEQDAEDVAQDGMLAMLKYLERMDAGKNHTLLLSLSMPYILRQAQMSVLRHTKNW